MPGEGLHLELRGSRGTDLDADVPEELQRLVGAVGERQRLGAREPCLEPTTRVGRDADGEKVGVDPEPAREPLDGVARRARLAALDLAHVLLRAAVTGELCLGQARRQPQRAHAIAEP